MNKRRIDLVTVIFLSAFVLFSGLWWGRFATLSCEGPANQRRTTQDKAEAPKSPDLSQAPAQQSGDASEGEVCFSYRSITHWLFDSKLTDWVIALFTIVLAWKTWGLHTATRGLQEAALEQAETTNRLFISDQRPWIAIEEISFASSLEWSDGGFSAEIRYLVKNIGKTPAVNLWINSEVIASPPENTVHRQQAIGNKAFRHNKVGATVFPGKFYELIMTVRMDPGSAQASTNYWQAFADNPENTLVRTNWLMPDLIGDISYRSTFSSEVLHTGFIRSIRRIGNKTNPSNVISEDMGDIPPEELRLSISLIDPFIK